MSISREQVLEIIKIASDNTRQEIDEKIEASEYARQELAAKLDTLTLALGRLEIPSVEAYTPVTINPTIDSGNCSLDLIKSLPEFSGDASSYPAWRSAASFAMKYYNEGSERYYVALGILKNRITGSANMTLSSFNTVLNFKAIIARLDQTYADKRPIYVLENELSILRQGDLSITGYYDKVEEHLTLIINKHIMTYNNNCEVIDALNERARENALRVFISGLRRPLCDILFSSRPKDLPTALAIAQELETNHRRYDFANTFAMGRMVRPNKVRSYGPQYNRSPLPSLHFNNTPEPMEVDPGSSFYKQRTLENNHQSQSRNVNVAQPQQLPIRAQPFKRPREQSGSFDKPQQKNQRVNFMSEKADQLCDESNFNKYDNSESLFRLNSDYNDEYKNLDSDFSDEINCLN